MLAGTITQRDAIDYTLITFLGAISPELCALICEQFTNVGGTMVMMLAQDSYLGPIQVLQARSGVDP